LLLALAWMALLRHVRYSGWATAILSLVGTVGHEAMHFAAGWLLGAKPVSISLFPKREGNRWVFGSVGFANLNIWNSAPVAFAPLLLAAFAWLTFRMWTFPAFEDGDYLSWTCSGYFVATLLTSSIPSATDIEIGAVSAFLYLGVGCGVWYLMRTVF
jgi:hypothetical protein